MKSILMRQNYKEIKMKNKIMKLNFCEIKIINYKIIWRILVKIKIKKTEMRLNQKQKMKK